MLRFAGFEFDQQRAELRGPDGGVIRLRPKTFDMLRLFVAHPGRILSKQELTAAVWPNVTVGDDSLSQCVREIRTALGDDKRQVIKVISGRGYLFDAEISEVGASPSGPAPVSAGPPPVTPAVEVRPAFWSLRKLVLAIAAGIAIAALAIGVFVLRSVTPAPTTISVMPIVAVGTDAATAPMAAEVTRRLTDGLAKVANLRVVVPSATAKPADFAMSGELQADGHLWTIRARMTRTDTSEVKWTASHSVDTSGGDAELQQSRLAASLGYDLALRINALLSVDTRSAAAAAGSKVAIEQATANINKTTLERFREAQTILETALTNDPGNVDVEVALAALQLRGIQMVWYSPQDSAAAEKNAKSILEHALRTRPDSIPVLEAYCRFLNATNQFVDSLVACAKVLSFDPWDGLALYHVGLAELQLGRFEDAVGTFKQADRFGTPEVSRWTWLIGIGWADLLLDRNADAVPALQRSIAITPASGRTNMLLAVAYHRLGREDEAKAEMAKALALRPGSTLHNVDLPAHASQPFKDGSTRILREMVDLGLPER